MKKQTTLNAMPYWFCTILFLFLFAAANVANAQTKTATKASADEVAAAQTPTVSVDDLQKQKAELETKVANGTATDAENEKLKELQQQIDKLQAPELVKPIDATKQMQLPPAQKVATPTSNADQPKN